ncbi:MAG: FHA domain-containing protein [Planctomycetaceae bacterium]|nr:FHA domain-containing protein [Planctomycetaceae bacterium]
MAVYLVPVGEGRQIVLDKAIVFVGRHPECDVVLTRSRKVSRKHCCIAQVNDHFVLRDLGSMNGCSHNGTRVEREVRIALGDEISIGDVKYLLESRKTPVGRHEDSSLGERPHAANGASAGQAAPVDAAPRPDTDPPLPSHFSQDIPVPISDDADDGQFDFSEASDSEAPPGGPHEGENSRWLLDEDA